MAGLSPAIELLFQWGPTLLAGAALVAGGSYLLRKRSERRGHIRCCGAVGAEGAQNTLDEGKEQDIVNDVNPPAKELSRFTFEELQKCNGKGDSRLFVGVQGLVYDVGAHEAGRRFYGPGGSYSLFAGREATTALAKMALDESMLNSSPTTWSSFSDEESRAIRQWAARFCSKYPLAGVVDFGPAGNEAAAQWREKGAKS